MLQFSDWCNSFDSTFGAHWVQVITGNSDKRATGIDATAVVIPGHYAAEEQISRILKRLGKPAAAALIEGELPTSKAIRSGELGEIYAMEWIATQGGYQVPIKRLRWKDHRNMAMRGDDVIGFILDPVTHHLHFLKTEAKSRINLTMQVITQARAGLDKDGGFPSAHALAFISARLYEIGNDPLAEAIEDALYKHDIIAKSVRHLLFTFSGNAPDALLKASLQSYMGQFVQWGVGLCVHDHAKFVHDVYDRVIANANNP